MKFLEKLAVRICVSTALRIARAISFGVALTVALALPGSADQLVGAREPDTDPVVYGEGVRPTPWLDPEQERNGFHLPPGFEVRLFASEPQIAKPLNLAFDDQGRIWVTQTTTYPHPAEEGAERGDAVMVLEDTDGDGRADRVTKFADQLNIPIGVLPFGDGCLCFSIPYVWYLRDTDGDGVCDRREKILGPFDTSRDTHGMVNSLRDGGDGWIYACHGFNNQSEIAGTDGHVVRMHSGNTFRFRPDGSRVEHVTRGQVNPFGMTRDEWGYWYSADCHSKPITQLIRGACYPSFGRPHDGLGFLPPTIDHLHGSTAISGIASIPEHSPLVPLRGQMISGNVMTSRINRTRMTYQGATGRGEAVSDFLTSDDPWFRPVDLRIGPDNHLYVADFYNRIIGHYEVPLNHPGRDRTSGRIWQICYRAEGASDVNSAAQKQGPTIVASVTDDEGAQTVEQELRQVGRLVESDSFPKHFREPLWAEARPMRRIALMTWGVEANVGEPLIAAVRFSLDDSNPHVRRSAAETLGRIGGEQDVPRLLKLLVATPDSDPVLRQTARIAIRDLLARSSIGGSVWTTLSMLLTEEAVERDQPSARAVELAAVLAAIERQEVVRCVLDYVQRFPAAPEAENLIRHAVRLAPEQQLDRCVAVARQIAGSSPSSQADLLWLLAESADRGGRRQSAMRDWASEVAVGALKAFAEARSERGAVIDWSTNDGEQRWPDQQRQLTSGGEAPLMSSHARGESYQGTLRSDRFAAPASLSFYIAGHNGRPDQADSKKNFVRLIAASTGETLQTVLPPRNDTAVQVHWDLSDIAGEPVWIECHDGDGGNAYAWIAIGELDPPWLNQPRAVDALQLALRLIGRFELDDLAPGLFALINGQGLSPRLRLQVAAAMPEVRRSAEARAALATANSMAVGEDLANHIATVVQGEQNAEFGQALQRLLRRLDSTEQQRFARRWLGEGAEPGRLLELAQQGALSPTVFTAEVAQMIRPRASEEERRQLESLVGAGDAGGERAELIQQLEQALQSADADFVRGRDLFDKHCAACHQLRQRGKVVGPQLDGVTTRTVQRLLEDVVTPNQNVDAAFRTTTFLLDDGRIIVGVVQSENADEILVADAEGKTTTIPVDALEERQTSSRSLMPDNFGELMTPQDFADLVGFIRAGVASP